MRFSGTWKEPSPAHPTTMLFGRPSKKSTRKRCFTVRMWGINMELPEQDILPIWKRREMRILRITGLPRNVSGRAWNFTRKAQRMVFLRSGKTTWYRISLRLMSVAAAEKLWESTEVITPICIIRTGWGECYIPTTMVASAVWMSVPRLLKSSLIAWAFV